MQIGKKCSVIVGRNYQMLDLKTMFSLSVGMTQISDLTTGLDEVSVWHWQTSLNQTTEEMVEATTTQTPISTGTRSKDALLKPNTHQLRNIIEEAVWLVALKNLFPLWKIVGMYTCLVS